jgi:hypothetical protein
VSADHAWVMKDGQPLFKLSIPGRSLVSIRYETERPRR